MSNERIEELNTELTTLIETLETQNTELIEALADMNDWEPEEIDHEGAYRESIDTDGPVMVCGYKFDPSCIIEELDPTAYRCGFMDYLSDINIEDDEEGKLLLQVVEDCNSSIEDTELEISELELEISELEEEE